MHAHQQREAADHKKITYDQSDHTKSATLFLPADQRAAPAGRAAVETNRLTREITCHVNYSLDLGVPRRFFQGDGRWLPRSLSGRKVPRSIELINCSCHERFIRIDQPIYDLFGRSVTSSVSVEKSKIVRATVRPPGQALRTSNRNSPASPRVEPCAHDLTDPSERSMEHDDECHLLPKSSSTQTQYT